MAAIPDIQLEVTYFMDNFGFAVRLPSALYFNRTEGLCGELRYICMKMYCIFKGEKYPKTYKCLKNYFPKGIINLIYRARLFFR